MVMAVYENNTLRRIVPGFAVDLSLVHNVWCPCFIITHLAINVNQNPSQGHSFVTIAQLSFRQELIINRL